MPKKVRELKALVQKAGFVLLPKRGKGSHSYWVHPLLREPVIISDNDGKDAKRYQEKDVMDALRELERLQEGDES